MATSYGITESGIKEYLEQELFQKEYVVVDKNFIFRSRDLEKFGNFSLTTREANKLAKIIHSCLFDLHPKLLEFVNYLNEIVEILYKLELPIIWIAPSGIKVNHTYKKFKTERISSSAYKGARRVTLQVPITKANLQNIKKGIVPNLIHSLDASNISILISHLKNQKLTHPVNLYTVHDCFATSIDKLPLINHLVREAFIDIYSSDSYISDFNNFVVQYIEKNNIEIVETKVKENDLYINKKGVIIPETNEMIYLPEVPKINNIPYFSKQVKQACYMIS
jgi:DNA-directed RNA polymerase